MKMRSFTGDTSQEILYELKRVSRLLGVLATRDAKTQVEKVTLLAQMGFSSMEIATTLNTTPQTVSVALHRIRRGTSEKSKKRNEK